ncbi:MAG: hypothetical protein DMF69_09120 [Acidobacteria bacterium]|nr:MAG: hypothetical protein DMF69_09120 [Acidobacteriota bacterium]
MRLRFPRTRFGRLSVRLNIVFLICLIAVSAIALKSFAQKRTAVRVTPGSSTTPTKTPRKSERERERERARNRQGSGTLQQEKPTYTPVSATQETNGNASVGSVAVQRTTEEINEAQRITPTVEREERLVPEREYPDRHGLPSDPNAPAVSSMPSIEVPVRKPAKGKLSTTIVRTGEISPSAPQTVSTPNFTAATLADTGAFPPDTMGAIGPTQFFAFLNGRLRTFNKTTGVADAVVNVDSDVFFASEMSPFPGGGLNFTSDPQIRYDRITRRWILCIIDVPSTSNSSIGDLPNRVLIAVSDAASNGVISGGTVWSFYFIQQDTLGSIPSTGEFLDYESLGIDEDALYIGGNMFGAVSSSFLGCSVFVVQKSSILSGGPIVTTAFRGVVASAAAEGPFSPRGVDNYATGTNEGYFIGVSNAAFSRLVVRRITNPGSASPTISANILLTVPATTNSESVPHLGNSIPGNGRLDALDDRLFAAHIRNGKLWTAHNIEVNSSGVASSSGNRDAVRWYELNGIRSTDLAGVPAIVQSGTIFDNAAVNPRYHFIPTVGISGQGHAAFGFSVAGLADRINAGTNGRLRTDTLGTTGAVQLYTASSTAYNPPADPGPPRRWGDYSFVSVDPKDDMTMWTIQEFCNGTNTYGTQVVRLLAPPPATPATSSVPAILAGAPSTNITVTGTSVSGSEFYDPGADIAGAEPFNHIAASVSGGVTVNSVTYTDPTHVILNVSTVGATAGAKDVTITNPDGQSMLGVGLFSVVVPAPSPIIISEFRLRGPSGPGDEFVELYNNSGASHTVAGGGTGYAVVASDGTARCVIPNGTVIPNRGHYLCTNSVEYSLSSNATGDATFTTDIPDNAGIAIFPTSIAVDFTLANRMDAVGSTSEVNTLYKEGSGYPAITPFLIDYSFRRDDCGKQGSITTLGACLSGGAAIDTNNNASDFYFVDTNGTSAGAGQRLGSPGPENLASPIQRNSTFSTLLVDATVSAANPPNRVRDFTSDPPNNSTFGTIEFRRRVVNNTGGNVTRLRFRIIDFTTFPAPSGFADLRSRTSTLVVVAGVNDAATCLGSNGVATTPCTINIQGTTLEQPPAQPNGGAFGSTYSAGTITLGTPLANGASINLRFLTGIQQTGTFKFFINVEALP